MNRFKLPIWVKEAHEVPKVAWTSVPSALKRDLKTKLSKFKVATPLATICIVAWNEEENLPRTLWTLAHQEIDTPTEILVVSNNSTDQTVQLCEDLGVRVINEPKQGIAHARQGGLLAAKGEIFLCCDADTLYPPSWAETLISGLQRSGVTLAYGRYSFLPEAGTGRVALGLYELVAERLLAFRRFRREYLNVRGPNFCFYTDQGVAVQGFEMKLTRSLGDRSIVYGEDGRMARKLGEVGKMHLVRSHRARVFTSHRQLSSEGSLWKVFATRVFREGWRMFEYIFGSWKPIPNTDNL